MQSVVVTFLAVGIVMRFYSVCVRTIRPTPTKKQLLLDPNGVTSTNCAPAQYRRIDTDTHFVVPCRCT